MKEIKRKILKAINKGLNEALDLDDFSEDDLKILKKSLRNSILNSNFENKKYYYQDLMNQLMSKDIKDISKKDILQCLDWYKEYNILYNPHLDGDNFKYFIRSIFTIYASRNINLNWIDTSEVTNMNGLFYDKIFTGDISKWDVSNVILMNEMFKYSHFNGDISNWDVSNVRSMIEMFYNSSFNQDISKWDVSNVNNMCNMFTDSKFNKDISSWNVSKVTDMYGMFWTSPFNQDISIWNINPKCDTRNMFKDCPIKEEYKPKSIR